MAEMVGPDSLMSIFMSSKRVSGGVATGVGNIAEPMRCFGGDEKRERRPAGRVAFTCGRVLSWNRIEGWAFGCESVAGGGTLL